MEQITGIILAGGKSTRMGIDKGLMRLDGKPMIQHILDPMAKICQRILIVSGNQMYGMFGFELVNDEASDYGPVMGILSGLRQSKTERNLILSCDSPFVTFELMKQLVLLSDETDVVAAHSEKEIHPLIAVYNRNCIPIFEKAVADDEHRLRTVLEKLKVEELKVESSSEHQVRNINTQTDLNT
ncbi:MAG: molybdenum cofactor guanylyltransferase [Flavobacteriales bacterium]|nr:molybdenum cofactor guanylyltransferase [Flavobacteriales bacterium]